MDDISDRQTMLNSLTWYMTARKTALRNALSFRTPLSVEDQIDLRIHYSNYFINIMSAVDLIRDCKIFNEENFLNKIYSRVDRDRLSSGKNLYNYVRKLRNAVVHRGLNITSSAHIHLDFPLILCESIIQDQRKRSSYHSSDKYLIDMIKKCEHSIGPSIHETLESSGLFIPDLDIDVAYQEFLNQVEKSHAIPDEIKKLTLSLEFNPDWLLQAHIALIENAIDALKPYTEIFISLRR